MYVSNSTFVNMLSLILVLHITGIGSMHKDIYILWAVILPLDRNRTKCLCRLHQRHSKYQHPLYGHPGSPHGPSSFKYCGINKPQYTAASLWLVKKWAVSCVWFEGCITDQDSWGEVYLSGFTFFWHYHHHNDHDHYTLTDFTRLLFHYIWLS